MTRPILASLALVALLATPASSASMLSIAQKYIGLQEAKHTASLKKLLGINPRHKPWCGAFANLVARQAGRKPPKDHNLASSWRNYGHAVKLSQAVPGDVLVMNHHVTIFTRRMGGKVCGLGGNQSNRIKESCYSAKKIRAVRR